MATAEVLKFVIEVDSATGAAKLREFGVAAEAAAAKGTSGAAALRAGWKDAQSGLASLNSVLGVFGIAIGTAWAAAKAFQVGKWVVGEALQAEEALSRLEFAVTASGRSWEAAGPSLRAYLGQLQATTRFSDEEAAAALERLLFVTGDYDRALRALGPTIDFASAMHVDLATAARLVGVALEGNIATLSRYGIVLTETEKEIITTGNEAARADLIIGRLNARFSGAAQHDIESAAGKWAQLRNQMSELAELVGSGVLALVLVGPPSRQALAGPTRRGGGVEDLSGLPSLGVKFAEQGVAITEDLIRLREQAISSGVRFATTEDTIRERMALLDQLMAAHLITVGAYREQHEQLAAQLAKATATEIPAYQKRLEAMGVAVRSLAAADATQQIVDLNLGFKEGEVPAIAYGQALLKIWEARRKLEGLGPLVPKPEEGFPALPGGLGEPSVGGIIGPVLPADVDIARSLTDQYVSLADALGAVQEAQQRARESGAGWTDVLQTAANNAIAVGAQFESFELQMHLLAGGMQAVTDALWAAATGQEVSAKALAHAIARSVFATASAEAIRLTVQGISYSYQATAAAASIYLSWMVPGLTAAAKASFTGAAKVAAIAGVGLLAGAATAPGGGGSGSERGGGSSRSREIPGSAGGARTFNVSGQPATTITISAMDGESVDRVVRRRDFQRSLDRQNDRRARRRG